MMGFGFLSMLLGWGALLVVLAGGAALVFGKTTRTNLLVAQPQETARTVLHERLAKGEISPEEYELIRTRLER
jgi:uncharacterized membrane protein